MKKYYCFCMLLFAGFANSYAQITITKADMPQPGDTVRLSTTTKTGGLPAFAVTGANYTWDYSKLVQASQTIDTFLSVSSTPFAYQFFFNNIILYPSYAATVAQSAPNPPTIPPVTITNVINYYKATSSAYESVGFGANIEGVPTSVKDDSIDYMYRFPMNYGNADSSNSGYHLTIPLIGYYGQSQHRVNHVDGWGTLITPYGTFQTLRVTTEIFAKDTLYIDTLHFGQSLAVPEQLQYKWFALGEKLPLLQINETVVLSNPVLTSIVYRDSARSAPNGLAEVNSSMDGIKVFPNPAGSTVYIISHSNINNAEIRIYNISGQLVMQKQAGNISKNSPYGVSINNLAQGTYYLKLVNDGSTQVYKIVKD